jgi:hypothetical protein
LRTDASHFRPVVLVPLAALAILAAGSLAWGARNALRDSGDLMRRAEEVALFLDRQDPYTDPDMTYPPPALPVFAALVGPFRAPVVLKSVWLMLNGLALAVLVVEVLRLAGPSWPPAVQGAWALAVVASKPVRLTLGLGQYSLLPLALLLVAVRWARAGRPVSAGALLALALIKPTIALPFIGVFAARRAWGAIAAAAVLHTAAMLGVSAWLGRSPVALTLAWLDRARSQQEAGLLDVASVVGRLWPGGGAVVAGPAAAVLLLGGWAAIWALRRRDDLTQLSLAATVAVLFTYHRPYDLVLLALPLALGVALAIQADGRLRWLATAEAVALAVLLLAPSHPRVWPEPVYEAVFIPAVYGLLAAGAVAIVRGGAGTDPNRGDRS